MLLVTKIYFADHILLLKQLQNFYLSNKGLSHLILCSDIYFCEVVCPCYTYSEAHSLRLTCVFMLAVCEMSRFQSRHNMLCFWKFFLKCCISWHQVFRKSIASPLFWAPTSTKCAVPSPLAPSGELPPLTHAHAAVDMSQKCFQLFHKRQIHLFWNIGQETLTRTASSLTLKRRQQEGAALAERHSHRLGERERASAAEPTGGWVWVPLPFHLFSLFPLFFYFLPSLHHVDVE